MPSSLPGRSAIADHDDALAAILDAVAHGRHPAPDGRVEVVPSPPGPTDAVVAFTAHTVVAADVDADAIAARLPADDLSAPLQPPFLTWLATQLRSEAGNLDVLLVAGSGPRRRDRACGDRRGRPPAGATSSCLPERPPSL